MAALAAISILIAAALVLLTMMNSEDSIMRAASWRLNIAVCFGAVMAYVFVIISGLDEGLLSESRIDGLCAAKWWMASIAVTLIAMPLFLKTYRVSVIFTESLKMRKMTDLRLMLHLKLCVVVDVVLLAMYSVIESPYRRHYAQRFSDGEEEVIDALQRMQYEYGVCSSGDSRRNSTVDYVFKSIIGFWKMGQVLFGIYCCLIVSRISNKTMRDLMRKFDETSNQLVAVVVIICFGVGLLVFQALFPQWQLNWHYGVQSAGILLICNLCLVTNLCPRLIAIRKGDQQKYSHSLEEEMRTYIADKMKEWKRQRLQSGSYSASPHDLITPKSTVGPTVLRQVMSEPVPVLGTPPIRKPKGTKENKGTSGDGPNAATGKVPMSTMTSVAEDTEDETCTKM